ncbi:unnamed protein product [Ilex paraguariensis]|uniref:Uncharacterized protein n=1 Tax=Ilex paraguariensis TaxID=185542 RepID=A0ABC8U6E8_9AQUA
MEAWLATENRLGSSEHVFLWSDDSFLSKLILKLLDHHPCQFSYILGCDKDNVICCNNKESMADGLTSPALYRGVKVN